MSDRASIRRLCICGGALLLGMAALAVQLTFLHLGPHDEVRERVKRNRHIRRSITVHRGTIQDRAANGNFLALDMAVKDVCADPMKIAQDRRLGDVAGVLAAQLREPAAALAVKLNHPDRRFTYVQRFVPNERAAAVQQMKLPGVFLEDSSRRFYPHRQALCHVIGFVNMEGVGSAGIEQRMEDYLRGTPGYVETEVNALRQEVYLQRIRQIPAIEGADVRLTVDQNIQYVVERALDGAMAEFRAKGAWAIVQRVKTGEILGMASRPGFDPNDFTKSTEEQRLNRCIGYVYEPGSTFKALTVAAALNEGTVRPEMTFNCENGAWFYGGRQLHDFHPYGVLTVADGLKKSSNIMAAKVALTLGDKRFHRYLRAFGIGQRSGIDLPGEETGLLSPPDKWAKITATRVAMGHGVAVTALQILNAFCTIANDGIMMQPYIVTEVAEKNGTVLYRMGPRELGRPITAQTAATMRELLSRVTEEGGTGLRARVEDYDVAGKTGTADKPINGVYSGSHVVSSFVGFLPALKPEIGIIVVVDEPQQFHTGGRVAAPYFCQIASEAVRFLDITPSAPRSGTEKLDASRVAAVRTGH